MSPRRPPDPAPPRWTWLWPAALVLVVVAAYARTLQAPFLFDDVGAVVNNASIRQLSTALVPPADGSTTTGRPVLNLSFALSYQLSGRAAWGYHALNIAIHAGAALALFGLVRRLLAGPVLGARFGGAAPRLAFAVALLWAVHPLQTESVSCVAQRTESLCGLFYLLTLYAFARGAGSPASRGWLALSVGACLAGMGTKEVMVTAPLLVLLLDRTFFAGTFAAVWRARSGWYLALAATWLLLLGLLFSGGGTRGAAAGLGLGVSPVSYLLKQCEALVLYLRLSVWPHPLVLDYGTAVVRSPAEVWWQGLLVLTLLAGTIRALVKLPVLGFAGAWFFLILAPSSSLVPLVTQTMAEHRMYLPLAAVVGLGVLAAYHWLGARVWPVVGGVAVVFAGLTFARNNDYLDPVAIWSATVAHQPQNARAHNNLGVELQRAGRPAEAIPPLEQAVALQPDYVSAHYTWGRALSDLGRWEEAVARLQVAVQLNPAHADARLALGNALVQAGRPAEALAHYTASLEVRPAADGHYNFAAALVALGRLPEAETHLRSALAFEPELAPARRRLGLLLAQGGRPTAALEQFQALVAMEPEDSGAHANLGNVYLMLGQAREAIAEYETALRLRPGDARTEENLRLAREALRQ